MQINRALLESSDITRHFMTATERQVKKMLCRLLIDNGHRKYAERFWKFDFNIVDAKEHPEFTAAISFDEATVFISSGFLGSGQSVFNQLDVLLRHELAHNLMMHQIRMMHVFKSKFSKNPDEIYKRLKYSLTLHEILNVIEDFEISNKRYSAVDKNIVRNMTLNGEVIGGLVTEDNRGWDKLSLEAMYEELSNELIAVNSAIRSNPYWQPKAGPMVGGKLTADPIEYRVSEAGSLYKDIMRPSGIKAPLDIFMKSKAFNNFSEVYKDLVIKLYTELKDCTSEPDKQALLDIIKLIADTSVQEPCDIISPITGKVLDTLYTPEEKMLASDILKNIIGNINYNPQKFKIKRKKNSQEYKDAWNQVVGQLDSSKFDDETLAKLRDAINAL